MPGQSRDIVVRFVGDYKSLGDGADKVTGRLQTVATSLKGIATAGAAVAAGAFLRDAITQASDLQEATSKTGVIFGRAAGEITKYAEGAADAIGQSKVAAMDAASTFATFGKSAGLTGSELSTFATELVTLSSDLASFHNATPEETVEALGAALRGEAEPIQRFGVLLNDATLREEALAQGLIKTTKEALTPQQKVLAAQGVVMKQTVDAQGDFQRTSDGLANSQRTLAARTADAAAELGQKFLPITQTITHTLADGVLPAVVNVGGAIADVLVPVVETAWASGAKLVEVWGALPDPIQNAAIAMGIWALVGDRVTGVFAGLRSGASGLGDDVKTAMGAFEVGRVQGTFMALEERIPVLGQMGQAFRDNSAVAVGWGQALGGAQGAAVRFGGVLKGVTAGALVGLRSAASGLVGFLGGPWGLALAGAAAAWGLFAQQSAEAESKQREMADLGKRVAEIMEDQANATGKAVRAKVAQEAAESGLLKNARELGISTKDVVGALMGEEDARRRVNEAIAEGNTQHDEEAGFLQQGLDLIANNAGGINSLEERYAAFTGQLDAAAGGFSDYQLATRLANEATNEANAAAQGLAGAHSQLMGSEESFQGVLAQTGLEYDANKTRLENLLAALQNYNNEVTGAVDSEESWFASLDALKQSVADNGTTLDIHTQKGRDNRDALQGLSADTKQLYLDNIQAGMSVEEATKIYDRNMQQVYATAGALGFNEQEARRLIETYGGIPKKVVTEFQTKGYDATWAKLNQLSAGQILGEKGLPVTPANVRAVQKDLKMGRYAHGGPVIGYGTGTSDDNLALLSNNEHVWTAREVQAAGGHQQVEALRHAVLSGALPAFAKGGAVTWPQTVDVSKFKIPNPMTNVLAWAASQVGKPYIWGGVGPNGYDCSGFMSAIMNVIQGRNPHSRRFATGSFPTSDFAAGPGRFSIGSFRGNPGHMAGTLSGVNVESRGGEGVVVGPRARGARDGLFGGNVWHLKGYAKGGRVQGDPPFDLLSPRGRHFALDRPGGYRNGGWLQPGQVGVNETSRPEPVLSSQQWDDLSGLVAAVQALVEKLDGKTSKVINVGGIHVTNRPVDVATQLAHLEALAGS